MTDHTQLAAELFVALQRLLPQHSLSRLAAKPAEAKAAWLKNLLIRQAVRTYGINLDEAISGNPDDYDCFNSFFTRRLRPDARPLRGDKNSLVSPADGCISQYGVIDRDRLIQAKGIDYSASRLLGEAASDPTGFAASHFANGEFMAIYLSPRDYHRVHMPVDGDLLLARYIPGRLFSVNSATTARIDNLFTRNERLVTIFDTPAGKCGIVMVGAMLVAGIASSWHGRYRPGVITETRHKPGDVRLAKGDELGRFYFGSTVIMLFERQLGQQPEQQPEQQQTRLLSDGLAPEIKMGQKIGAF